MITCFIRYEIDPFQLAAFREYAENWGQIIPRCGGNLLGYFLPHEGTSHVAWGLLGFDSLASYEAYRTRLKADSEGRANFAQSARRESIFTDYRLRVAAVMRDYGMNDRKEVSEDSRDAHYALVVHR